MAGEKPGHFLASRTPSATGDTILLSGLAAFIDVAIVGETNTRLGEEPPP
jgi:hypothetical protein